MYFLYKTFLDAIIIWLLNSNLTFYLSLQILIHSSSIYWITELFLSIVWELPSAQVMGMLLLIVVHSYCWQLVWEQYATHLCLISWETSFLEMFLECATNCESSDILFYLQFKSSSATVFF